MEERRVYYPLGRLCSESIILRVSSYSLYEAKFERWEGGEKQAKQLKVFKLHLQLT